MVADPEAPWAEAVLYVVEVSSPSQGRTELAAKAHTWLDAGMRLVWILWPEAQEVGVYEPGADAPVILGREARLDGGDVLPGFNIELSRVWE